MRIIPYSKRYLRIPKYQVILRNLWFTEMLSVEYILKEIVIQELSDILE